MLLYFGYTMCPDFCPTTLTNLADVLGRLGKQADDARVLFVTVDPGRDTLPALNSTRVPSRRRWSDCGAHRTNWRHWRAAIAWRIRSRRPATVIPTRSRTVLIVYVFDQDGNARLLVDSMATQKPDVDGTTKDLKTLIAQHDSPGLLQRILRIA